MKRSADNAPLPQWQRPSAGRAYVLLAILMGVNILNFIDRKLIVSFSNFIVPELHLTNAEFGLLTGFIFLFTYVVGGLVMGAAADTVNRPRLIAVCLMLWSALTAFSGAARNFVTLAIPRAFIGVGESGLTPSAISMLSDAFPPAKHGMASSLYFIGLPLGAGLSLVVAGTLGELIGWRGCFFLLGSIGVAVAIGMMFLKDPKPAQYRNAKKLSIFGLLTTIRQGAVAIASSRNLRLVAIAIFLINFIQGVAIFDQLWLVRERGFARAEIARTAGYIYVIAGIAGTLFGAFVSDYALRKWGMKRMHFLLWSLVVLAPTGYFFRLAPVESWPFWLGFFGVYFQVSMYTGPLFAALNEITPTNLRATITGAYVLMMNTGIAIANFVGGALVDLLQGQGSHAPYTIVMVAAHVIATLGVVCLAFVRTPAPGPQPA